ncbi:anthocyanidin 3-O-glucosyltransferase 5-like [Coffea eugenioides]|uniref:anthocyanidin 3-O-glucosyltransferase 5-like n=1 Tax=Coffea eugenioides TaxID=49369 RepID=UPI000F60F722|nr:anthocyanidin 3-O-glucosyltransferase 5-like [Coffea eugenioides]
MDSQKLHVAILASPGLGHLIPVLVLGNRLATHHAVKVTVLVLTTSTSPAESQLLKPPSGPKVVDTINIPPVDISHLIDANTRVVTQLCIMVRESLPGVRSTIAGMKHRPNVLIADLFCTEAFPIATEFNIPKYLYIPTTAWFTALTSYCPVLHEQIDGQYVDQSEPLQIPGCKPVRPQDVVDPMLDRNDPQYREYLRQAMEFQLGDGILMNTWEELEPVSLEALRRNESLRAVVKPPVYPIGPLTRPIELAGPKSELIEWLDKQPHESVIFVCFGSGGTLSAQQITELAWGLELSQQRFIWVVRPPAENGADESFFTSGSASDGTPDYLPEGFLSRTKKTGWVVPLWAQQPEILNHPSVGGFLSHCGWNSAVECIKSGVPMIAWPLYAEQRLNATMLTEELGIAVRPEILPAKKVVDREEIEKLVRTVMEYKEGKVMRDKVKKLKNSAENALNKGGSSYDTMCNLLRDIQMRLRF